MWVGWPDVTAWMTTNQALAAWVQAVGAIAAIVGAAAVATSQAASGRREAAERRLENELAKLQAIKQIIRRIVIELNHAKVVIEDNRTDLLDAAVERIEQVRGAISRLPVFEFPTPELVFLLLRTDRDLYLVTQTLQRFQGNPSDRHSRQALVSIARHKGNAREARDHCEVAISNAEKRHAAILP